MKKVLIMFCNPKKGSFSEAIANSYREGTLEGNNEVKSVNVYDLDVSYYSLEQTLAPHLQALQSDLLWADNIVFVYPVWCLGIPAKLKSLIEMTFQSNGSPLTELKGKSAVVIQTYGMPEFVMRYLMGDVSYKMLHGIFKFCGIKVQKRFDLGQIAASTESKRCIWLNRIKKYASKS